MNSFDTRGYVNQLLVGLLVTIGFGGTVGVGTVWMRHQVSVVADANASLLRQITEVERRIADTNALVEEAMSSDVLRAKNESMGLGLVAMTQTQVNHVQEDPIRRLVARANQRAMEREAASSAIGIQVTVEAPALAEAGALPQGTSLSATHGVVTPRARLAPAKPLPATVQFAFSQ